MDKKIVGGGLTGEQLYNFIGAVYIFVNKEIENEDAINKTLFLDGFVPLKGLKMGFINYLMKKPKEIDSLYNDTFKVYFNVKNGHIVACHRGTYGDKNISWIKDIGNNLRPFTYRRLIAKNGHNSLLEFFIECANEEANFKCDYNDYNDCLVNIRKIINKHIFDYHKKVEGKKIEEIIKDYFQNKLTTIGHSQGATYAYLFGKDGKEIITYNPAPFPKTKPDNTYDVRIDKDFISKLSGFSFSNKDKNKTNKIVLKATNKLETYHVRDAINGTGSASCFFGDNQLYSLADDKKSLLNNANKCEIVLKDKDGVVSEQDVVVSKNEQDHSDEVLKRNAELPIDDLMLPKTGGKKKSRKKRFSKKSKKFGRKTKKVGFQTPILIKKLSKR